MRELKDDQSRYYRAIQEVVERVSAPTPLKEALSSLVRTAGQAMKGRGCSLTLLDAGKKKLVHVASWGLSERYLRKGALDADKSLPEVLEGHSVSVADVATDPRLQYPELAAKARIASLLAVPLVIGGEVAGSLRVYTRERRHFSKEDIRFLETVSRLGAVALQRASLSQPLGVGGEAALPPAPDQARVTAEVSRPITFAHPSEEDFANLLDFYQIEWVYEPRSFPLRWDGERVTEMSTPDFYLPVLDMYVELTTMKQSLVTDKNRKLRWLKELYPEVNIKLLYKRDYDQLLAKYGYGPLAEAKVRGMGQVLFSGDRIQRRVQELARQVSHDYEGRHPLLIGVLRGVFCFMADLVRHISIPLDLDFMAISYYTGESPKAVKITKDLDRSVSGRHVLVVEDIIDTGMTLSYLLKHLEARGPASLAVCTLLDKGVRRLVDMPIKYVGFQIPDEFVVGYGLDYQEEYRNLPFIGVLEAGEKPKRKGRWARVGTIGTTGETLSGKTDGDKKSPG